MPLRRLVLVRVFERRLQEGKQQRHADQSCHQKPHDTCVYITDGRLVTTNKLPSVVDGSNRYLERNCATARSPYRRPCFANER